MTQNENVQPTSAALPSITGAAHTDKARYAPFDHLFEMELEIYGFANEAQKTAFHNALRTRVEHDDYLWYLVEESIGMAAMDIAEQMNLQQAQ